MTSPLEQNLKQLPPLDRVETIVKYAYAANPRVREDLANALANAPYRFAVLSTLTLLATDSDEKVRSAAIRATRCRFRRAPKLCRRVLGRSLAEHEERHARHRKSN